MKNNNTLNKLLANPTTPIENKGNPQKFYHKYLDLCRKVHQICSYEGDVDLIKFHIKKLGKQKYRWDSGEYRFWIWELGDEQDTLRVFVNNTKGIVLEVSINTSLKRALRLVDIYAGKILK